MDVSKQISANCYHQGKLANRYALVSHGHSIPAVVYGRESQCAGKKQHVSELHAQRALNHIRRHKKGTRKVTSYLCPHCHNWHNGKMPVFYRHYTP